MPGLGLAENEGRVGLAGPAELGLAFTDAVAGAGHEGQVLVRGGAVLGRVEAGAQRLAELLFGLGVLSVVVGTDAGQ